MINLPRSFENSSYNRSPPFPQCYNFLEFLKKDLVTLKGSSPSTEIPSWGQLGGSVWRFELPAFEGRTLRREDTVCHLLALIQTFWTYSHTVFAFAHSTPTFLQNMF